MRNYLLYGRTLCLAVFILGFIIVNCYAGPFAGKVGVGLEGAGGRAMEFVDAAKTARPYDPLDGDSLSKDAHGWPLADAYTVIFDYRPVFAWAPPMDDPDGYQPDVSGTYKLSFTGQARLMPRGDPSAFSVANQKYDQKSNTTTADIILPKDHNLFIIEFHDTKRTPASPTNTGFANVRLIRPGYSADTKQIFTNEFLRAVKPFRVLRFMDWLSTNNQAPHWGYYPNTISWDDRKLPNDATQIDDGNKRGVAWEYVIELANVTGKDIWINIPDIASDNYVEGLGKLLKSRLKAGINIYVEHSNEVWNWGFMQSVYNRMAAEDEISKGKSNLCDDGKTDIDTIRARRHARRTMEIGKIVANALGPKSMITRVRPVLAWWTIYPDQYEGMLEWAQRNYGKPSNYFYGIGSTGYINAGEQALTGDVPAILAAMRENADGSVKYWDSLNGIAKKYGIKSLAYEGGSDTGGGDPTNVANRIRAERSAEMANIIGHHIKDNWFGHGGDLFMYFTLSSAYSRYGCWGLVEDIKKLDTHKYKTVSALAQ